MTSWCNRSVLVHDVHSRWSLTRRRFRPLGEGLSRPLRRRKIRPRRRRLCLQVRLSPAAQPVPLSVGRGPVVALQPKLLCVSETARARRQHLSLQQCCAVRTLMSASSKGRSNSRASAWRCSAAASCSVPSASRRTRADGWLSTEGCGRKADCMFRQLCPNRDPKVSSVASPRGVCTALAFRRWARACRDSYRRGGT